MKKIGDHMRLSDKELENREQWTNHGYTLPQFDRHQITELTKKAPQWIHFGAGNIFRAFPAALAQDLINKGKMDTGIIAAEGFDYEIIEKMYRPHDNLSILVTLKADGHVEKTIIGSVVESLTVDCGKKEDFARLKAIVTSESLQMISFTITEKGYCLVDGKGAPLPDVSRDMANGPKAPVSYIGKVSSLLYERFLAGQMPIAMVSMDNCSHNGDKLFAAVDAFAKSWVQNDLVESGFLDYVEDEEKVSFPWSMIDKITPRPDASVEAILEEDGVCEPQPIVTSRNTYIAPFVNAEECQYLVVEDSFPNGRPSLEAAGVIFTTRDTVNRVEKMKVCTCLNPLHTTLAVLGCLLGYERIWEEMKNPQLKRLVEIIGYQEGLPVVVDPKVLNPKEFIDAVVNIRIPNPFMPDTPQRIATDTSQKVGIRFGETIKAYAGSDTRSVKDLKMIPLVFAGWLRYLMGVDDNGDSFVPSSDPLLEMLQTYVSDIHFGDTDIHTKVYPILSDDKIFGSDLYKVGLGTLVEQYFVEMLSGKGAVSRTLEKYVE